jgi:hypothetical protein
MLDAVQPRQVGVNHRRQVERDQLREQQPPQAHQGFRRLHLVECAALWLGGPGRLGAGAASRSGGREHLTFHNPGRNLAFAVHLKVRQGPEGEEVLPVIRPDNYFPLLPGESREPTATYRVSDLGKAAPIVELKWNWKGGT